MATVPLAEAKARLSELVDRAGAGEDVYITRRGKVVARIDAADREMKPIDIHLLQATTSDQPHQREDAGSFTRALRDDDRY